MEDFESVLKKFGSAPVKDEARFHDQAKNHIQILTRMKADHLASVKEQAVEKSMKEAKWRRIEVAIDSGACDNVIDPDELPEHNVRETAASRAGEQFASATGDPIPNLGEMGILMITREDTVRAMAFTAAPVARPLGSVKKICKAGHRVVFDDEGSYIYNKYTGEVNMLREELGNYIMDVWVPPPGEEDQDTRLPRVFGRQLP